MSSSYDKGTYQAVETPNHLVTVDTFYGVLWMGFVLCLLAGGTRIYVRLRCFHKLLIDDWVMLFALVLLLCSVALGQVYLDDVYMVMGVSAGVIIPDASFPAKAQGALRGFGIAMLLTYLGIWAIKLNFLLFFKRLGTREIRSYSVFWWVVLVFTLACGVVSIGLMQFHCLFGPLEDIMIKCPQKDTLKQTYDFFKVSCIVDVLSDAFILLFPLYILWKVSITLKRKFILSAIFSLVVLTMAITVVRGSIFGGVYKTIDEDKRRDMNVTWIWFWFHIEFSVSFIVACLVSFRALFAQRGSKADASERRRRDLSFYRKQQGSSEGRGFRHKAKLLHDSLLASFKESETMFESELPVPESGRFSPTFLTVFGTESIDNERKGSPTSEV